MRTTLTSSGEANAFATRSAPADGEPRVYGVTADALRVTMDQVEPLMEDFRRCTCRT